MDDRPASPTKVIGVATNYRRHGEEMGRELPMAPRIFLMPTTAVCGHGDPIRIPSVDFSGDAE